MSSLLISDEELGDLHRHCFRCYNLKRCNKDGDACPTTSCSLGCGAIFHECKEQEHFLLCSLARVPCINYSFGCDLELVRRDLGTHLERCPASIVACTQEWNRWPLHCRERYKTIPFRQRNPTAARGQLDYELAIRDQEMVGDFNKVPRKTKLALRNNLTRRFPALPVPPHIIRKSNATDKSQRSLREAIKFEVSDSATVGNQYGIAKVFLKQQEVQHRRWQDDVDKAIQRTGQPVPKKYWEYPDLERGNVHQHCAYCYDMNCNKKEQYLRDEGEEEQLPCCSLTSCSSGCGAEFHVCKGFEHKMICPLYEEESEFDWMHKDGKKKRRKKKSPPPLKPFPDLLLGPTIDPPVKTTSQRLGRMPVPPPPPQDLHQRGMRFDIKVETVTRLQQKPRAMYTFLCGAELRRDQWEGHCRNVHSEIHGGLNNWIEARCPLSSYGCSFSMRRLFPGSDPQAEVVFSQAVRSFGIKPPSVELPLGDSGLTLVDLPVELLQYILSLLDQWSLCNVSLTCHTLREVACSLLDLKGCVALQWEKSDKSWMGRNSWEIAYKRWFFSSYFHPVHNWGLNTDGLIAEHLKKCPYNIKTVHVKQDKNSKLAKSFMEALNVKMKLKQQSEWFIK